MLDYATSFAAAFTAEITKHGRVSIPLILVVGQTTL